MRTLRQLREAADLTQLEVANRLGVTPGTVYNWERGKGEPRARQVLQLAALYGVSTDEIFRGLPEPEDGRQDVKLAA